MRQLPRGGVVFWLPIDVGHVNDGAGRDAPCRTGRRVRRPGRLSRRRCPEPGGAASLGREVDGAHRRSGDTVTDHACTRRAALLDDRFEHRLHVRLRAADDAQDVARGGLRVERRRQLAVARLQLREEPHVLDRDDRLVGEGLRAARSACPRTAAPPCGGSGWRPSATPSRSSGVANVVRWPIRC